jgi:hypothetical protein
MSPPLPAISAILAHHPACKPGRPIMIQTPAQQAMPASGSHRIHAQLQDCTLYQAVSRSPYHVAPAPGLAPLMTPLMTGDK